MRALYAEYIASSAAPRDSRASATSFASAAEMRPRSVAIDADIPAPLTEGAYCEAADRRRESAEDYYLRYNAQRLPAFQHDVELDRPGRYHPHPDRLVPGNLEVEIERRPRIA